MSRNADLRSVCRFYLIAVAISWVAWLPLVLSRSGIGLFSFSMPMPWTIAGTVGPPVAAMLVWRQESGAISAAVRRLVCPTPLRIGGAFVAVLAVAITFVGGTAIILSADPPHGWQVGALSLYGFHAVSTLLGGPIFEEWGWRGVAQPRLQEAIGPLPAALVVGVGWGLWHLPLFFVPAWSSASLPVYVAMVTGLSVMMAWGFNASGGWIVVSIAMHYTYNASSRVLGGLLGDAPLRAWLDPVAAILLAFTLAAILIVSATRGRLGLSRK